MYGHPNFWGKMGSRSICIVGQALLTVITTLLLQNVPVPFKNFCFQNYQDLGFEKSVAAPEVLETAAF